MALQIRLLYKVQIRILGINEFQYRITIDSLISKLTFNQIETKNQKDGAEYLHPIKPQLNKSKKGDSEYRNRPF